MRTTRPRPELAELAAELANSDEAVRYPGRAFRLLDSLPGGEVLALAHELAEGNVIPADYGDFARLMAWHVVYRRTLATLQADA